MIQIPMKSISHCIYTGSGVVAQALDIKETKRQINLQDVRAGMVFPTGSMPGYFLILGREVELVPTGKPMMLFIHEAENIMHELLFQDFTDACTKFKCKTVYAYLPRQDRKRGVGGYDDLWKYLRNRRLKINLVPAPAAEDVEYGKALLREFWTDDAFDLPPMDSKPTVLRQQLKQLVGIRDVSKDNKGLDESLLYAFHALRYVLTGFIKFTNVIQYLPKTEPSPRAAAGGWT